MTNSRANKTNLEILDNHLATGTEATYTYTPSIALDLKAKYSSIEVTVSGKSTAAFELLMKINAQTNYDYAYHLLDTTTLSGAVVVDAVTTPLVASGLIDGAELFMATAKIICNDATDFLMIYGEGAAPHEGLFSIRSTPQTSATTITSIEIKVSGSTWVAGTEIHINGILR